MVDACEKFVRGMTRQMFWCVAFRDIWHSGRVGFRKSLMNSPQTDQLRAR